MLERCGRVGTIRFQNVTKQYGGRVVLDDVSFELTTGHVVGIVGPNGAGKTTLFKLMLGQIEPDIGTVTRSRGLELGYLSQEPAIQLGRTVHDEALSAFEDLLALETRMHELGDEIAAKHGTAEEPELLKAYDRVNAQFVTAGGYEMEQRLNEILGGVGFAEADYKLPISVLSGGQKCRVALAKLLLRDQQYLLLDEPTNHLDIDAVRWLEKFLAGFHGGAAIISHDRYLLDRVADAIIEVDRAAVTHYPGNYSSYAEVKALRRLTAERQYEKDREFIEKEQAFIAKHLAGQRSSEAKGRRTRLERRLKAGEFVTDRPAERAQMSLKLDDAELKAQDLIALEGVSKRYGERVLFENLSLTIKAGQRLGITGPNGTGKSTLLKAIVGQLPPDAGRVSLARQAALGYYAQEARELDPAVTILTEIQKTRPDLREVQVRGILGRFLFSGDDAFKPIGALSGGEQSRVRLIKLMLAAPNVLVLDEPTNHLDIPSREALEDALEEYGGTIIVVSHDRYFLDRVVEHLLVLRDGRHELVRGNYSMYVEQVEKAQEAAARAVAAPPRAAPAKTAAAAPRPQKPKSKNKYQLNAYQRMTLEELEAFIHAQTVKIADLTERFGAPEIMRDRAALAKLDAALEAARKELAAAEEAWLEQAE